MRKTHLNIPAMVWVLVLVLAGPVSARIIYVDPNGSADFTSIQAAIDDANDSDEIEVSPGTYNEAINFNGKAVRLYSSGGPEVTIIDGTGAYHVVQCVSGEDANTILESFTITGGNANGTDSNKYGGGMYCENSSPTVTDCTFSGNSANGNGGGMYNYYSSPTVTNCTFTGNSADDGGGMYNYASRPTVTNCTFSSNTANYFGGGMVNDNSSSPKVTNCTFVNNTSSWDGGGMFNVNSNLMIANCTFNGNSANGNGGGMYCEGSTPIVTNCTFSGNSANEGGGMCNLDNSRQMVTNCIFRTNNANYGGGMYNDVSSPTVTNCTFSGNSARWGGGMYNYYRSPTVTNCILWGNTPDEIFNDTSSPTVTYSDVDGGTGQSWFGTGCIDADPCFVDAAAGNLRLSLSASPCVDAGNNSAVTEANDLAGNPRVVDGDRNGTAVVDMGAYELQVLAIHNITQDLWYDIIQAAINEATNGDEIEVAPGTYNKAINFNGKAVRLYSSGGPEVTTIDGTGAYHVVQCVSGEDANTILEGFTITGGNANGTDSNEYGGGMYNEGSSPTVTNCTFTSNRASYGGGMLNNGNASSPTVTDCTFSGNWANYGGGMFNYTCNPTVTNCTFTSNRASYGGGMLNIYSSPTVTNCTFSGNSGAYSGGGMYNSHSSATVTNCTFSGNISDTGGGGMYNYASSPTVTNCTFSGNSARWGGGMSNYYSSPTVTNCILWDDTPPEIFNLFGSATVTYSDVEGGWGDTGNIDADPCFVDADGGNLRLSYDSPCIDTGNNAGVPAVITTDLDGHPRIIDGDCNDTDVVDMGAYEFNYAYMGDLDYNCRVDFFDFSIFGQAWMTKEGDPDWDWACDMSDPPDDYIDWRDVAVLCENWLAGTEPEL